MIDNKPNYENTEDAAALDEIAAYDDGLRFVFPEGMYRVSGGLGGESWLITGSDKTALYDCGMVFHGRHLAANIRKVLEERPLDYVLLSHSHYDHLGGLPYVREAYPNVEVLGAAHAAKVAQKDSAKALMTKLANSALKVYGGEDPAPVTTEGLTIDRIVKEGDVIDLGNRQIRVFETGGHTDCSLSYGVEPEHWLIASESTGIFSLGGGVAPAIVKSYEDAMVSAEKMKAYGAKEIFTTHYGRVPPSQLPVFFDLFVAEAERQRKEIEGLYAKGHTGQEIVDMMAEQYAVRSQRIEGSQLPDAFAENVGHLVRILAPKGS